MDSAENSIAKRLVERFGGRAQTAKRFGRSVETIRLWLENGIPLSQAIDVECKSEGFVTAEEILKAAKLIAAAESGRRAA